MTIFLRFILLSILIFLNGFFVTAEYALVSVRKTRIDELVHKKNKSALLVQKAIRNLNQYISATQFGVTMVSIALGWLGEPTVEVVLENLFSFVPKHIIVISTIPISIGLAFLLVSFIDIVFGELAPKTIALQQSEKIALFIIRPLMIFAYICRPVTWFLNKVTEILLRVFRMTPSMHKTSAYSEEEIRLILLESAESGVINEKEVEMVDHVFKLGHMPIHKIMTPFEDVVTFPATTNFQTLIENMKHEIHMRFPIYGTNPNNIIGFIHMKDIFPSMQKYEKETRLFETDLIRPILHVIDTKRIGQVMFDMQRKQTHIVVIANKDGEAVGLITLEDMVESVMGEMQDEFKNPIYKIKPQKDGSFLIGGLTYIRQLQSKFKIFLQEDQFDTIEGVLFGQLKHAAKVGDRVNIEGYTLQIEIVRARRIIEVRIEKAK